MPFYYFAGLICAAPAFIFSAATPAKILTAKRACLELKLCLERVEPLVCKEPIK